MLPKKRAEQVKAYAAALEFDACGIAAAGFPDPEDRLGAWLAQGFDAGMAWMAKTKAIRQDVRERMPGARSVVVVARSYYSKRPEPPVNSGRVSRHAWGRDYHAVLRRPVQTLADYIAGLESGALCFWSVDTGPVMEKAWAVRAGLGWIGKNGLVLREGLGSWFFLGVIATTVELAWDEPAADRCGACAKCIEACPTRAIVAPHVVDSRRCISYHTIEQRGAIPPEMCREMGTWVFGCDLCQEVCPWNHRIEETSEKAFHPDPKVANPDLHVLAQIDDERFRITFAGSVLFRTKSECIRRNARIVLENQRRQVT